MLNIYFCNRVDHVKSSVLFEIHTLLNESFRVLQLPRHQSNLTANG